MGAPEPALRLLVELGGNVKALDSTGRTPLHHAASGGRAELCRALVQAGCPINQKSQVYDTTAYEYALHYGHADVLRELARLGAQVRGRQEAANTGVVAII
jgi:ankyrin repeat protein